MKKNFFLVIQRLISQPPVGGLEIRDSAIRFLRIEGEKIVTASFRLPPGIILDGKINDRQNFLSALKTIYSQLVKTKTGLKVQVIVCLPLSIVYSQSFSIPVTDQEGIKEAAELNLRMISPINIEKAYSDWQIIGENTNQREILGAFAEKSIIDEYKACLQESGFFPVAFEFPAISLTRLIKDSGLAMDINKSYLVINISTDGLNLLIIRKGELYFNHFLFWRTLQGEKRQIFFSEFKNTLVQEIQKIVNFLSTGYKESFEGAILITPALEKEVEEIIQREFGLKIIPLRLRRYDDFSIVWFSAFGSALRGLIPRRQDAFISLTAHNVVEEFYREQILSFISLWRNILFVSLLLFLLIFSSVDIFLNQIQKKIETQLASMITYSQTQEVGKLQEKAKVFNELVALITSAKTAAPKWSPLFEQLNKLAGNQIVFDRIIISSLTAPVRILGRADNENIIIDFKKTIASQSNFTGVDLPLAGIHSTPDRRVGFEITFVIKSLTP